MSEYGGLDLTGYTVLRLLAETFDDAQDARKRIMNRLGLKADGTPQKTGARVPEDYFLGQVDLLLASEKEAGKHLDACYRSVAPAGVIEWQKATFGLGDHLVARWLGAIGHPRVATPCHWEGEGTKRVLVQDPIFERTISQLRSYCGHGDAERKKRKGMTAEEAFPLGSPRCKMLTYLNASGTVKCFQPVAAYDAWLEEDLKPEARAYVESVRATVLAKCRTEPSHRSDPERRTAGPTSSPDPSMSDPTPMLVATGRDLSTDQPRPATTASSRSTDRPYRATYERRRAHTAVTHPEWTDGHSANDALRIVGKHLLADLWKAAA